jgi:hypothetical protein
VADQGTGKRRVGLLEAGPERSAWEGVTQTIVAGHAETLPGNCVQACIATVFGRPLEEVPHFALFNSWHQALNLWLSDWYDLAARIRPVEKGHPDWLYLLIGGSPRNADWSHIVVGWKGRILWDPHPSRAGLTDERQTVEFYSVQEADA